MRDLLRRYLESENFTVSLAENGKAMRRCVAENPPNLILLDLMMPDEDGLALTRWVRAHSPLPIIMLTNKSEVVDRVVGLEVGADDYLPKPFDLRELLARIRAVLRRTTAEPSSEAAETTVGSVEVASVYRFDEWVLYPARRELRAPDGQPVALTTTEFDLLFALIEHANRILSRDQLMDLTKGRQWSAYDRAIDTHILRLRRKIETDPKHPELIKSVRGVGYMFAADVRHVPSTDTTT